MKKPVVLLDCDGILANFVQTALGYIAFATGKKYQHDDVRTWDVFDTLGDEALKEKFYTYVKSKGTCRAIGLYEGAQEGVCALREVAEVVIVTSPFWQAPTWAHEREEWLREYFGCTGYDIIHARKKHHVRGDFFVDDKVEHAVDWQAANPEGRAFIWDRVYNREAPSGFPRLHDWPALIREVSSRTS